MSNFGLTKIYNGFYAIMNIFYLSYSRYYKMHLYEILSLFGATCIQIFDDFFILKPWKLLLGVTSIQVRLIFKSVL